jgi:activator of HSP90 ATPase
MFIENFVAFNRAMPTPDDFTYRLMKSVMYGSGGVAVWYAQVLDAAAYSAIAKVSAVTTEIENFLLDGTRCDKDLAIPPMFDKKAVFAYKLGEKRCVVVFNHSGKNKKIRLSWRTFINKPDTVELVTKRQLAASKVLDANLKPHSFAVFVTLSEGN